MRADRLTVLLLVVAAIATWPEIVRLRPPRRLTEAVERWRERRTEREAARGLPSACAELAAHVRAGRSLAQAVADAADGVPEPIASRLRACGAAVALGTGPADALRSLGDNDDVRLLTAAVGLQARYGGDLAMLLDGLSELLVERADLRRAAEVATAQARATARMVIGLPVAALGALWLLDRPALGMLAGSPIGWAALATSAGLCVLGSRLIAQLGAVVP
jgi:tight adherence protein B